MLKDLISTQYTLDNEIIRQENVRKILTEIKEELEAVDKELKITARG